MSGPGVELRMQILRGAADQQMLKPLRTHGWEALISSENTIGEYLLITATKSSVSHKVALLYSSATDNAHYKALAPLVEHIFTNGDLYHLESFAYGITTPVTPIGEFFPLLVKWNTTLVPASSEPATAQRPRVIRHITAESPLESVWARLDQFASIRLAEKLINRRANEAAVELSQDKIAAKAAGVAFAVRNASDYFRAVPFESLNKRILSLYYGVLALAFAEMLASPLGPSDLDEVEGMTKHGHGFYTVPSSNGDFGGLHVGVLATGFFPQWASFLGYDTQSFPKAKAKTQSDLEKLNPGTVATLSGLLSMLPELGDLFFEVFDAPPSWVVPIYDHEANPGPTGSGSERKNESTYIQLLDVSGRLEIERLQVPGWPITELAPLAPSSDGQCYRARVDHPGFKFWYEVLPIRRSPFGDRQAMILPVLSGIHEYRAIAMAILYALSILVRYMPSAWRRVEDGDWDHHLALVKTTLGVLERLLPEEFLESITGERIHTSQPGSLF